MPEDPLEKLGWFGFLVETSPDILYHYTSMEGLLGIVDSGRIHATDIRYLNDESELNQVWDSLQNQIRRKLASATGSDSANLQEILRAIENRHTAGVFTDVFVASFSEVGDSLSQWRAYSRGGIGLSIGFNASSLRTQLVAHSREGKSAFVMGRLARVRYISAEDDPSIDSVINAISQQSNLLDEMILKNLHGPEKPSRGELFRAAASVLSPVFKHNAFSEEREWRLILSKTQAMPLISSRKIDVYTVCRGRPSRRSVVLY